MSTAARCSIRGGRGSSLDMGVFETQNMRSSLVSTILQRQTTAVTERRCKESTVIEFMHNRI
jgi:hypothetical protein